MLKQTIRRRWKHFVFLLFLAEHEVTQLICGACLSGCSIQAANIGFALASSDCTQLLLLSEKGQTILVVNTTTKYIPRLFLPDTSQRLVESQPVIAWNPGRELHIFSPKAWAMSCTGMKRCRFFTPVRNHNSGQAKLLKWLMLRTRTSVSGDWITSRLSACAAWLACKIILVSASSWFDVSAWTTLH